MAPLRWASSPSIQVPEDTRDPKVVAFGGGHGLAANLQALKHLTRDLTAVVTVADDGGSSGRLRDEMDILPPGDLRMALAALCDESPRGLIWREVVQHRFDSRGPMHGHALGNLLLVSLWQMLSDPIAALDQAGDLLGAKGRVLPMALDPLDIEAEVESAPGGVKTVRGQANVAAAPGRVRSVSLIPEDPRVPDEVLQGITDADWLIVGPGSWFTSVMPHLLIREIREAFAQTSARCCVTMNLSAGPSETAGLTNEDLLRTFHDVAPNISIDAVIADPMAQADGGFALVDAAESLGAHTLLRQVSVGGDVPVHDPLRLAAAYRDIFDGVFGDVRKD